MTITTAEQLRKVAKEAGNHFFTPSTMEFFGSRLEPDVFAGRYFVTSEQEPSGIVWDGERRWTIRSFEYDGETFTIDTVSEFGEFASYDEAKEAIGGLR